MKKTPYVLLILIMVAFGAFIGATRHSRHAQRESSGAHQGHGMHHQLVDQMYSDNPGTAACGTESSQAEEGAMGPASSEVKARKASGSVRINHAKQQLIGIRIGTAELASQTQSFRTLGRVAPDENRLHRVVATVDGWVREVYESTIDSQVQKDQVLVTYFTIEFLNKQQQYLYAVDLAERQQRVAEERSGGREFYQNAAYSRGTTLRKVGSLRDPVELSRVELLVMGVGETQIEEILRSREYATNIEVRSPATGVVLARSISPDQKFERGTEMFLIADLSRVWIMTYVYEGEAEHIRPGMVARITLPRQEKAFYAVVSHTLPRFDAATRTFKVRLELDNPDLTLRPDMFADVEFIISHPPSVTVPVDAVLDSGLRKTVFVDRGNGYFEPRNVEIGWRSEERIQIANGLEPGERIAVSGSFLIDSESRLNLAAAGMCKPPRSDHAVKPVEKPGMKGEHDHAAGHNHGAGIHGNH